MRRFKRQIKPDKTYLKELNKEERLLYKRTIKQVEEVNKRLRQLEKGIDLNKARYNPRTKRYERTGDIVLYQDGKKTRLKQKNIVKYKAGTWATKKLANKLGSMYNKKQNKITIPKKIDVAGLRSILKATKNFLESQTSTTKGINKVEKNTKETIKNIISDDFDETNEPTEEEVETLYSFWNDKDFIDATEFVDPSDLFVIISDSANDELSDNQYLERIKMYTGNDSLVRDEDMREKLLNIYHKYFK